MNSRILASVLKFVNSVFLLKAGRYGPYFVLSLPSDGMLQAAWLYEMWVCSFNDILTDLYCIYCRSVGQSGK